MAIMNLGQIVYSGSPSNALEALNNKVWRKTIERAEKEDYKSRYHVISDKMVGGRPQIHVLSDADPGNGFQSVAPNLEDVFFTQVNSSTAETMSHV
jgi:hypothetical protein